jgi:diguanylate cyclase (GGDEF)-like protein
VDFVSIDPDMLPDISVINGVGAGVLIGILLYWLLSKLLKSRSAPDPVERDNSDEEELKELRKSVWILQNESKNLSTFLMMLPEFARQINNDPDKRKVAPMLRQMIEQIFDPQQVLIFYTSQNNDGLVLANGKGIDPEYDMATVIPFGEGRVGWIASHQISMDESDFQQKARFLKNEIDPAIHPNFNVELAVPMAHQEELLGVITVGGKLRHPKNEKTMLRMVGDLGSVALNNANLFQRLEQIANSDGLTGLCNKRMFMSRLADAILKAEKFQSEFSLFMFDIDHFKNYNDKNGHLVGDEGLKLTGQLIRETARADDLTARYGGEEFVILLPNTSKDGAMIFAEKLRCTIQQYVYPKEENQPGGDLTISGGVSSYPYDGRTSAELISAADAALYRAKRSGRNKVLPSEPTYLSEETAEETLMPILTVQS